MICISKNAHCFLFICGAQQPNNLLPLRAVVAMLYLTNSQDCKLYFLADQLVLRRLISLGLKGGNEILPC